MWIEHWIVVCSVRKRHRTSSRKNNSTQQNTVWSMNRTNYLHNDWINNGPGLGWHLVGTADFNRDTLTDLLWHNASTGQLAIWLMQTTNIYSIVTNLPAGEANYYVVGAGDLKGDGFADIIWHHNSTDDLMEILTRSINNLAGPWTVLNNSNAVSTTSYTDNPAPAGAKMYRM